MRKPVVVTIPHRLSKEDAKSRLQSGLVQVRSQLISHFAGKIASVEDSWTGDRMDFRFAALGQAVTGRIDVMDEAVRVEVDLPWIFASLAERVRARIQRQGTQMLEKK